MVRIGGDSGKRELEMGSILNFMKNIFREFSFYVHNSTYLLVTKWPKSGGKGRIGDVDDGHIAYYPINSFFTEFLPISIEISNKKRLNKIFKKQ